MFKKNKKNVQKKIFHSKTQTQALCQPLTSNYSGKKPQHIYHNQLF